VRLSRESDIPLVATNDCHYLTQADSRAQEILMCIQTGKTMSDSKRMRFATINSILRQRRKWPGCLVSYPKREPVRNSFPDFKIPEGHTLDSYFERVVREGYSERAPSSSRPLSKAGCGTLSVNTNSDSLPKSK